MSMVKLAYLEHYLYCICCIKLAWIQYVFFFFFSSLRHHHSNVCIWLDNLWVEPHLMVCGSAPRFAVCHWPILQNWCVCYGSMLIQTWRVPEVHFSLWLQCLYSAVFTYLHHKENASCVVLTANIYYLSQRPDRK